MTDYPKFARGVAHNIRFWRRMRHLDQHELAAKTGVSRGRIAVWEAGTATPTLKRLWGLAKALDIEPVQLLGGRGSGYRVMKLSAKDLRNSGDLDAAARKTAEAISNLFGR